MLVFYCHGWKNNAQSDDVVKFNDFLDRLGQALVANGETKSQYRVHGVYLGWRGNEFSPYITTAGEFERMRRAFGEPKVEDPNHPNRSMEIVDRNYGSPPSFLYWVPEQFTYPWERNFAEHTVSGVPMARTIFTLTEMAKRRDPRSQVLVIGHSFGALMLEKAFGQATVGLLAEHWRAPDQASGTELESGALKTATPPPTGLRLNPLPFDCVIFVNSAAPSIYAKELSDFLWGYRNVVRTPIARVPMIVSVTSAADSATRFWSPISIGLTSPIEWLRRRDYTQALLKDKADPRPDFTKKHRPVPQRYLYMRTPGHNPLLVDHWVVPLEGSDLARVEREWPASGLNEPEKVMAKNLQLHALQGDDFAFYTRLRDRKDGKTYPVVGWKLISLASAKETAANPETPEGKTARQIMEWSKHDEDEPFPRPGAYWNVRCDQPLIKNHGDVWSDNAMALYVAVYGRLRQLREAAAKRPPTITVMESGDVDVASVAVTLRAADGTVREQGPAQKIDGRWHYTMAGIPTPGEKATIEVTARENSRDESLPAKPTR